MTREERARLAWERWLETLSPHARAIATGQARFHRPKNPGEGDYASWVQTLSPQARDAVEEATPVDESDEPEPTGVMRFCLIEVHDGCLVVVRVCKSAKELCKHMGSLEGKDINAIPFFGRALLFSKGPPRYLELPDGMNVMQIPRDAGGPCRVVDRDLVEFEHEDTWYIGPKELIDKEGWVESLDQLRQKQLPGPPADDSSPPEGETAAPT